MFKRTLVLPKRQHCFLFGARNTGKSTLLHAQFPQENCLWFNLLDPQVEDQFAREPQELAALVAASPATVTHIIVDEVQKVPRLLDLIHHLIESTDKIFIMSGSSARKLKRGGANLLAGRAFVYHLYPLTFSELGERFVLNEALHWGLLPQAVSYETDQLRRQFLQAYALTYLKEEISMEQVVRRLNPFRRFLEVAAQCNGKIVNFAKVARDVGVDPKTVREYFQILEDTLLGFFLEPFQTSFRKRLSQKPKFYLFDPGIVRVLARRLSIVLQPGTSAYGEAFEHLVILECMKATDYAQLEYRFSYLSTKDDMEIDLIVERPGQPLLCIEIKSATHIVEQDLTSFIKLTQALGDCEAICLCNVPQAKQYQAVLVLPWREGIKQFFIDVAA
jgi:predicted AAA+ superfamily ATPase